MTAVRMIAAALVLLVGWYLVERAPAWGQSNSSLSVPSTRPSALARLESNAIGPKVALVVGNSAYRSGPTLRNPGNDAVLMARTLTSLGFTLVGDKAQLDLSKPAFDSAVQQFGRAARGAGVVLFYYSGHGLQVGNTNWLVPVEADPTSIQDLDFQMVSAQLVLRQMEGAGAKLNVVILDACRNNPFGGRGLRGTEAGLGQMQAPEGTIISYATQPGNVALDGDGKNSPYTLALVDAIQTPGLDVFNMFNRVGLAVKRATGTQLPWVSNSPIEGNFYFAGPLADAPRPQDSAPPAPSPAPRPPAPPAPMAGYPAAIGAAFKDCPDCPEMVVIPPGRFQMGSQPGEPDRLDREGPQHEVVLRSALAVGRYAVTFAEWDACAAAGGCTQRPNDAGWGRARRPVINVSWEDAHEYARWVSGKTGRTYRLLTEAEWEYAARGGTTTAYWWGPAIGVGNANCNGCGSSWDNKQTAPVGSFRPNPFGLYDMLGNVWQWVEDCYVYSYAAASSDASTAVTTGGCARRVVRGGSWNDFPGSLRAAYRYYYAPGYRNVIIGFRLARTSGG